MSIFQLASLGNTNILHDVILTHGPSILNQRDCFSKTPLLIACESGQLENVQLLIEMGAEVEAKESLQGTTPLIAASSRSDSDIIKELFVNGHCNVNAKDNNGRTAFLVAAKYSKLSILKQLVEYGASPHEIDQSHNNAVLQLLCNRFRMAPASTALSKITQLSTTTTKSDEGLAILHYLVQDLGVNITTPNSNGYTSLILACMMNNLAVVQQLLDWDIRLLNATEESGKTALMFTSDISILKLLLSLGANLEARDSHGYTALMLAAADDNVNQLKALLAVGAQIDQRAICS